MCFFILNLAGYRRVDQHSITDLLSSCDPKLMLVKISVINVVSKEIRFKRMAWVEVRYSGDPLFRESTILAMTISNPDYLNPNVTVGIADPRNSGPTTWHAVFMKWKRLTVEQHMSYNRPFNGPSVVGTLTLCFNIG